MSSGPCLRSHMVKKVQELIIQQQENSCFPPGWSITAYALATMAKEIRAELKGASEAEKKEIARVNGYVGDGVTRLEAALADVEKLEQVLEA